MTLRWMPPPYFGTRASAFEVEEEQEEDREGGRFSTVGEDEGEESEELRGVSGGAKTTVSADGCARCVIARDLVGLHHVVSDLKLGRRYRFRVRAESDLGRSRWSEPSAWVHVLRKL